MFTYYKLIISKNVLLDSESTSNTFMSLPCNNDQPLQHRLTRLSFFSSDFFRFVDTNLVFYDVLWCYFRLEDKSREMNKQISNFTERQYILRND